MPIHVGVSDCSKLSDPYECGVELAREARAGLPAPPSCVIVFSPYLRIDHAKLLAGIRSAAGDCALFGGTTYGGILGAHLKEDAVVLMALGGDLRAGTGFGKGLARDSFGAGRDAARMAKEALGVDGK